MVVSSRSAAAIFLAKPCYDRVLWATCILSANCVEAMNSMVGDVYSFDHEMPMGPVRNRFLPIRDALACWTGWCVFRLMVNEDRPQARALSPALWPKADRPNRYRAAARTTTCRLADRGKRNQPVLTRQWQPRHLHACCVTEMAYHFIAGIIEARQGHQRGDRPKRRQTATKRLVRRVAMSARTCGAPYISATASYVAYPSQGRPVECRAAISPATLNPGMPAMILWPAGLEGIRERWIPGQAAPQRNMYNYSDKGSAREWAF